MKIFGVKISSPISFESPKKVGLSTVEQRRPRPDGDLIVEFADGSCTKVENEDAQIRKDDPVVFISNNAIDHHVRDIPPTHVHVPVQNLTARNNPLNKSEHVSKMRQDVNRSSFVVNKSSDPENPEKLDAPFVEIQY